MLSTVLVEHPTLVRVGFWVAVLVGAAVALLLRRTGSTRLLGALLVLSLVGAAVLTLTPTSTAPATQFCFAQASVPFTGIDTLANVALLYPATLFAVVLTGRPVVVLLAAVALSGAVEVVQGLVPAIGRSCDTDDLLMNATGALLAAVVGWVVLRAGPARPERPLTPGAP